jgi:imidazolonepropionase-like amidohydrolase
MAGVKSVVIRGATLIDGTGSVPQPSTNIKIEDGKIVAIAPVEPVNGGSAEVLDASGCYVLPGLIDCHVHIAMDGSPEGQLSGSHGWTMLQMLKHAQDSLKSGFTTLRDVGGRSHLEFDLRKAIETGLWAGPRLALAGKLLSITSSGTEFFDGMYREADGEDEVRKATREQIKAGADHIKVMATGAVMTPGEEPLSTQYNVDEMRVAVDEAGKAGKYVAAHAHAVQGIRNAVEAGVKTVEHGTFLHEDEKLMELMAKKEVFLVPTLKLFYDMTRGDFDEIPTWMVDKAKRTAEHHRRSIERAISHGVPIAMGTDACTPYNYHGDNAKELELMEDCGMKPMQAIMAATRDAARAIGWGSWLGTLEVGKAADLIVLKKNPLENLGYIKRENIVCVMKAGEVVARPCECSASTVPQKVLAPTWTCCGVPG